MLARSPRPRGARDMQRAEPAGRAPLRGGARGTGSAPAAAGGPGLRATLRSAQSLGELDAAFPSTTSVSLSCLGSRAAPGRTGCSATTCWTLPRSGWSTCWAVARRRRSARLAARAHRPGARRGARGHRDRERAALRVLRTGRRAALGALVGADGVYARTARTLEQLRRRRGLVLLLGRAGQTGQQGGVALRRVAAVSGGAGLRPETSRDTATTNARVLRADHGMVGASVRTPPGCQWGGGSDGRGPPHGGEPRAVQLHLSAHADAEDVAQRSQEHFGGRGVELPRD
ncbi:hypothetical protein QJS66_04900 [Kocuria rhizophila]|nr:hypothetical protein QJS66_04900 [Kocuria rhizophila]